MMAERRMGGSGVGTYTCPYCGNEFVGTALDSCCWDCAE